MGSIWVREFISNPDGLPTYCVSEKLGEGGMGVVWKAVDTTLDRDVAIKVLSDDVAHDAELLSRFKREARTLAALNHSHIGGIYGIEDHQGTKYLVLEYIDGETLAERIARCPLRSWPGLRKRSCSASRDARQRAQANHGVPGPAFA
jgi:serine/threonine protein kinase